MLNYYDIVMWVDADSLITNLDYKLQDFQLDDQNSFYASWDWTGNEIISTGNFIIKKTERTNELLNAFVQIGRQIIENNQWGEEQTTINVIYRNTNLSNTIKVLDHMYLNGVPSELMNIDCWKNAWMNRRQTLLFLRKIDGRPSLQLRGHNKSACSMAVAKRQRGQCPRHRQNVQKRQPIIVRHTPYRRPWTRNLHRREGQEC
jgi:hypothetical protein